MNSRISVAIVAWLAVALAGSPANAQSTPSQSEAEGRALLARVVQGLGGETRVRTIRSVRARATARDGAESVKSETLIVYPDTFVQRQTRPEGEVIVVVTPRQAFVRQPGGIEDLDLTEADTILEQLSRDPFIIAQHASEPGYQFVAAGSTPIDGVNAQILDVTTPVSQVRWFVDPRNGRIVRASYTTEDSHLIRTTRTTEDYSDWRTVDGVVFFFKEVDTDNGEASVIAFDGFEVNPTINPGTFSRPGRDAPASSNAAGRDLIAGVVEALGGTAKVMALQSFRARGDGRMQDRGGADTFRSEAIVALPDRVRHVLAIGPIEISVVRSGLRAFLLVGSEATDLQPASGEMAVLDADPGAAAIDPLRDPVFIAQHAGDASFLFAASSSSRIGNVDVRVLDVSHPRADVRWFIDARTNRVMRATWKIPRTDIEVSKDYAAWTPVDGLWFPFSTTVTVPQGRATTTEFKTIEINPATNAALFEKPSFPPVERVELKALGNARAIRVSNAWNGLGTPSRSDYTLRRGAGGFAGGPTTGAEAQRAGDAVSIPMDTAQSFLKMLGDSRLEDREYVPRFEHTDDYPTIEIEITLDNGPVSFHTESQGADHVPWAATIDGKTYVIPSAVPARALELLAPFLARDASARVPR